MAVKVATVIPRSMIRRFVFGRRLMPNHRMQRTGGSLGIEFSVFIKSWVIRPVADPGRSALSFPQHRYASDDGAN